MCLTTKMVSIRAQLIHTKTWHKLFVVRMSSDSTKGPKGPKKSVKFPEPPNYCCRSGCDNCVWIRYAEELTEVYRDGGLEAHKQMDRLINDPSLKAFIKQQIKDKSDDN